MVSVWLMDFVFNRAFICIVYTAEFIFNFIEAAIKPLASGFDNIIIYLFIIGLPPLLSQK